MMKKKKKKKEVSPPVHLFLPPYCLPSLSMEVDKYLSALDSCFYKEQPRMMMVSTNEVVPPL